MEDEVKKALGGLSSMSAGRTDKVTRHDVIDICTYSLIPRNDSGSPLRSASRVN